MASLPLPTGSALAVPLPHSLTPSPRPPLSSSSIGKHIAVAAGLGIGVGMAVAPQFAKQRDLLARNLWEFFTQRREPRDLLDRLACMSLATEVGHMDKIVVEPSSGASFPAVLNETKQLAGIGLRRRSILGLKNVDVYAFVDDKEVGTIQSQLLCRSLFDLYIGKDPFDKPAKENIGLALASLISK